MSNTLSHKTNFTSGEVSHDVLGRTDLRAFENGAARLKNIFIDPIGGISRRAGLRFIDDISDARRLIPFTFNTDQTYLIVVGEGRLLVYHSEELIAQVTAPWTGSQIDQLAWTQSADTLLLTHPNLPPKKLIRTKSSSWILSEWVYDVDDANRRMQPYYKFADSDCLLTVSGTGTTRTLATSKDYFVPEHVGIRFRVGDNEVEVTSYTHARDVKVNVIAEVTATHWSNKTDWKEAAFSPLRGYPATVTFYQGRLVIGGSLDLPNQLWLSKTFHVMNFDLGTGLDDEGIEFSILSDQVNAIRGLVSDRHLQVFTSGAEWMVSGDPLTPRSIQLKRQTRIGSPSYTYVPPIDVAGATLFATADGREIREFLFADLEQAYQSKNVSLLSSHLIKKPIDLAYDSMRRLVYAVMADGTMTTLTNYRTEEVLAWSSQETAGRFLAVGVLGDDVYMLVDRDNGRFLEVFDDDVYTDCALLGETDEPHQIWTGVAPLIGHKVKIVADGHVLPDQTVMAENISLPNACLQVEIGLPYHHEIVPLPAASMMNDGAPLKAVRLIEARFRIVDTQSLEVDVGNGFYQTVLNRFAGNFHLDAAPKNQTQDVCVHALGWIRDGMTPLWQIKGDMPKPCKIVSVTTDMKVSE